LASSVLIYGFIGTGSTFLAYSVLAAKLGLQSTDYPNKGIFYLGGFTESTETITVFIFMCLLPAHYSSLAYSFAFLCALTTITRIIGGMKSLNRFQAADAIRPIDTF